MLRSNRPGALERVNLIRMRRRLRLRGDWRRRSGLRALAVTVMCRLAGLVVRPSPPGRRALPDSPAPSIVVIKPLAIGDILRTTPFLDALRRAYPRARIVFAVGDYAAVALANNPHIDDVLDMGMLGTPRRFDVYSYLHFVRHLRDQKFDLAFVLDRSPLMALLPFLARVPRRIGLHSKGRGFAHTTRVKIKRDDNEVETYLRVAEAAGIASPGARCHYYPTPRDTAAARRIMQEFGVAEARPLVMIAPGGGVNPGAVDVSKRWPVDHFARVADALVGSYGASVILVGLPSDVSSIAALRRSMRFDAVDLAGQTSFGQLAALIQESDLFLGNDSASAQLAACVDTASVTVFTTTEPWIYGAKAPHARWVYRGDAAQGLRGMPDAEAVIRAARDALEAFTRADAGSRAGGSVRPKADSNET